MKKKSKHQSRLRGDTFLADSRPPPAWQMNSSNRQTTESSREDGEAIGMAYKVRYTIFEKLDIFAKGFFFFSVLFLDVVVHIQLPMTLLFM